MPFIDHSGKELHFISPANIIKNRVTIKTILAAPWEADGSTNGRFNEET